MLILAATPLGNLGDASQRLKDALAGADLIVSEDTRVTGKLIKALGIEATAPMVVANEHSEADVVERVLEAALSSTVVFVSDAGMPGISDPGFLVVKAARERGVPVSVIPGASAGVSALAVSGLPTDRFIHEGFVPRKGKSGYFESLVREPRTMVFFESPHRLAATLREAAGVFGHDRPGCVVRELTKMFEEVAWGTLEELAERFAGGTKGEIVVVIGGHRGDTISLPEALAWVEALMRGGAKRSDASAEVAKGTSFSKGELYRHSLE